MKKNVNEFLKKKMEYLRGERKEDIELPLKMKKKEIDFVQDEMKKEMIKQFHENIELKGKNVNNFRYKDFFLGNIEYTKEEDKLFDEWKKDRSMYPSEYGVKSIVYSINKNIQPRMKVQEIESDSEELEESIEDEILSEVSGDDEKIEDEIRKMMDKQNISIRRNLNLDNKINEPRGTALPYFTENDKKLINAIKNTAKGWLGRDLTEDELKDNKFIGLNSSTIMNYYANEKIISLGYLIKVASLFVKDIFLKKKVKETELKFRKIKKEDDKVFKDLHESWKANRLLVDKLIVQFDKEKDEETLSEQELNEWLSMGTLKEHSDKWKEKYETTKNIAYLYYSLLCMLHACGALRTSFYLNLKIYTSEKDLKKIAMEEWKEDYGKWNPITFFPRSHNFIFIGEFKMPDEAILLPDTMDTFYYVNDDKVSCYSTFQRYDMKIIPIKDDLVKLLKYSLRQVPRLLLLGDIAKNDQCFRSALCIACHKKTSTRILRIAYETERYIDQSIIGKRTRQFSKDCKYLRHQERIVLTNYVKVWEAIPELVEKVKNHINNIEIKKEEKNYNEIEKSLMENENLTQEQKDYLEKIMNPRSNDQNAIYERRKRQVQRASDTYKLNNKEKVAGIKYVSTLNRSRTAEEKVNAVCALKYKVYATDSGFATLEQVTKKGLENPRPLFKNE